MTKWIRKKRVIAPSVFLCGMALSFAFSPQNTAAQSAFSVPAPSYKPGDIKRQDVSLSMRNVYKNVLKKPEIHIDAPLPQAKPVKESAIHKARPKPKPALSGNALILYYKTQAKNAQSLYYGGRITKALEITSGIADQAGTKVPLASWLAGLTSWQKKEYGDAAKYFAMTGDAKKADAWTRAAGYYWTARALMRAGQPENVTKMLGQAARYSETFYGMLANFALGQNQPLIAAENPLLQNTAWHPKDGFQISESLLYAIIQQESRFNPRAKSKRGAMGLMQIMPDTAAYMTGKRVNDLRNPSENIAIGQQYLSYLMDFDDVSGDLVSTLVAYNAGPGNLKKWKRNIGAKSDPLYFIESLPAAETRAYVERVLYNYWSYQMQNGQRPLSLAQIAQGRWAQYDGLDEGLAGARLALKD